MRAVGVSLSLGFLFTAPCSTAFGQMHFDVTLPDYRSPKHTLRTYLLAVKNNDVAGAKKCWWINDPEQTRILDILAEQWITEHQLNQIIRSKFSAEDQEQTQTHRGVSNEAINRTIARLERSDVDVKGDSAVIRISWQEGDGRGEHPVFRYRASRPVAKLRRVAGDWKLDANWEIGFQRAADFWVPQSWFYFSPEQVADNKKLIDDLKTGRIGTVEQFNRARHAAQTASYARDEAAIKDRPLDPREECFFVAWRISVRYDREFYMGRGSLWGLFHWSQRLLDAELARSRDDAERQAAADAHVERIENANYEIKERARFGRVDETTYLAADAYLANAKVARAKAYGVPSYHSDEYSPARVQLTASRLAYESVWERAAQRRRSLDEQRTRFVPPHDADYWSNWWLKSALAIATNKAEEQAAAEAFFDRAEKLLNIAKKEMEAGHLGKNDFALAALDRARGEFLVRKLRWERREKDADVNEAARAQVAAARTAYEGKWKSFLEGRGYYVNIYDVSSDWRSAADWLAKSQAEKVAAAEAHLARMKPIHARFSEFHREGGINSYEFWATEFYVAEAEIVVAQAKEAKPPTP